MKNILDFIDSYSICNHNKDTKFTPAQQAVIVLQSEKRTINDKLEYLHYLLGTHKESDFTADNIGTRLIDYKSKNFYDALCQTVSTLENALENQEEEDCIYEAHYTEYGDRSRDKNFYETYEDAMSILQADFDEFYSDDEDRDFLRGARITKYKNNGGQFEEKCTYYFDKLLRMTNISIFANESADIRECYVYLPVPFKCGDIVKYTDCDGIHYGVFSDTLSKEEVAKHIDIIDYTDMCANVKYYQPKVRFQSESGFYYDHIPLCDISSANPDTLTDDNKYLKLLSHALQSHEKCIELLEFYSWGKMDELLKYANKRDVEDAAPYDKGVTV